MLISKFVTLNIEEYIIEFEKTNKITIPEQYKEFLMKYNGGRTPKTKFKIKKISSDIRGFYGLGSANEFYNYLYLKSVHVLEDMINDCVLPISKNTFGDYVVIGIGKENQGQIYFYYHDRPKKYIELCESFKEFISKCKSEKIGHIDTIEERIELVTKNGFADRIKDLMPVWQEEIDLYSNIHQEELILE